MNRATRSHTNHQAAPGAGVPMHTQGAGSTAFLARPPAAGPASVSGIPPRGRATGSEPGGPTH
jgi:hypothetical protein